MWFSKKGELTETAIADLLHCSGLDAYENYKAKGYSREEWDAFRLNIAKELIKRAAIYSKR